MEEKNILEIGSVAVEGSSKFTYEHRKKIFSFASNGNVAMPNTYSFLLIEHALVNPEDEVLDIGTGTGIIGIILAGCYPIKKSYLTDINKHSIEIAKLNAKANGVDGLVEIRQGPLFLPVQNMSFDLILSDPPQTPTPKQIIVDQQKNTPDFYFNTSGGEDGLETIRPMIQQAPMHLKRGGRLQIVIVDYLGTEEIFDLMSNVGLVPKITAKIPTWLSPMTKVRREYIMDKKKHLFPVINGKEYMHLLIATGHTR